MIKGGTAITAGQYGLVFASLAPARRRLAFVLLASGLVVLVVAVLLAVRLATGGTADRVRPLPEDIAGPVLLVPGYGWSKTGVSRLAAWSRDCGSSDTAVPPGRGG